MKCRPAIGRYTVRSSIVDDASTRGTSAGQFQAPSGPEPVEGQAEDQADRHHGHDRRRRRRASWCCRRHRSTSPGRSHGGCRRRSPAWWPARPGRRCGCGQGEDPERPTSSRRESTRHAFLPANGRSARRCAAAHLMHRSWPRASSQQPSSQQPSAMRSRTRIARKHTTTPAAVDWRRYADRRRVFLRGNDTGRDLQRATVVGPRGSFRSGEMASRVHAARGLGPRGTIGSGPRGVAACRCLSEVPPCQS